MKFFTVFTKQGRVEIPMPENKMAQAEAIMKNPLGDITEKLREMNDLSNKLTKVQIDEVEKVEFIDVDGKTVTLLKGGPGSGCQGPNCGRPHSVTVAGKTTHFPDKESADAFVQQENAKQQRENNYHEIRQEPTGEKDITPTAQDEVTNAPRQHDAASNAKFKDEIANRQVGRTIADQLGGRKFQVMTGAKDFVLHDKGISFRLPKANDGINHVKVSLNNNDLYDVTFSSIRGTEVKEIAAPKDIDADRLESLFTDVTGLRTSLTKGGPGSGRHYEGGRKRPDGLPSGMVMVEIPNDIAERHNSGDDTAIADHLSDKYGYLVSSVKYKTVGPKHYAAEIKWDTSD